MNSLWKSQAFLFVLFFVVACGNPSNSTNSIPQASDPTANSPDESVPTVTPVPVDPRIPALNGAVPINLLDKINYSGLSDIAKNVFLPLVGDPKIVLHLPNTRDQILYSGDALIAFEDKAGFWGAQLPAFAKGNPEYDSSTKALYNAGYFSTVTHVSSSMDMIFGDSELVLRVVGTLSGDDIAGKIYYRIPTGTETACHTISATCNYNYSYVDPSHNSSYSDNAANPKWRCTYASDTASKCTQYMATTNSQVKELGSFAAKYTNWATLPEGQ